MVVWLRGKTEESPGAKGSLEECLGWGRGEVAVGRREEAHEGLQTRGPQDLGGPLTCFIWLPWFLKYF